MLVKDDVVTDNSHTNTLRLAIKERKIYSAILLIRNFNQLLTVN